MDETAPNALPPAHRHIGLTGARAIPLWLLLASGLPWLFTTGLMVFTLSTAFLVMFGASWGAALTLGAVCALTLAVFVSVKTPLEAPPETPAKTRPTE